MQWGLWDYIWAALGAAGAVVMWGTQVGPKQVVSHTAEWAATFGVRNPPAWLKSENADRIIRLSAATLVIVCCLVGLSKFLDIEKMDIGPKILFAGGCIALVVSMGWQLLTPSRAPSSNKGDASVNAFVKNVTDGPIEWRFDKPATIFLYSRKPGEGVWIDAIVIHGTNKTDKPLKNVKAFIIPDMTDQIMDMRVNPYGTILAPAESAKLIPPRASFDLTLTIPSKSARPQGLPAEQFLTDYGGLKFSFQYDSGVFFNQEFPLTYMEDQIAFIEEQTKEYRRLPAGQDKKTYNGATRGQLSTSDLEKPVGLVAEFDPQIADCIRPWTGSDGSKNMQLRMRVTNKSGHRCTECRGFIIQIIRPDGQVFPDKIPLTWAIDKDITDRTLHDGEELPLNLVAVSNRGWAHAIAPSQNKWASPTLFPTFGLYKMRVSLASAETAAKELRFLFNWTGDLSSTTLREEAI